MKKSFRAMISLLVVTVMMVGVIGCGSSNDAPAPAPAEAPAAETPAAEAPAPVDLGDEIIELRVLNYLDLTSPGAIEEIESIWEAFETAYPNIKIIREDEYEEAFHNKMNAYVAAGNVPDVFYAWPSARTAVLYDEKILYDLAPLIERDGLKSKYTDFSMNVDNQYGGYLGVLPQGASSVHCMYVNTAILAEVGLTPAKTYTELAAQVPILKAAGYETIVMSGDAWVMGSCMHSMLVGRFMGEDWEEPIFAGTKDFTDPAFLASVEFVKKMYDDGVLDPSIQGLGYGDELPVFANGKAAYLADGDWRVGNFITSQETGIALIDPEDQKNIEIMVFPEIDLPGVKIPARTTNAANGTGWGMNSNLDGAKMEAAWTLVKWLVGKEVLTTRLVTGGVASPSRTDIDLATLPLEPMQLTMSQFGSTFDVATITFDNEFDPSVNTPLVEGFQALAMGQITPQQIVDQVQAAWEAWKAANP